MDLCDLNQLPIEHRPIKRLFDIIFAACALVITSPLLAAIALAVRLTSAGPILYAHERVGRRGRTFRCYKFRTMHMDADERLEQLLRSDAALREEWGRSHKLKKDPRVTPLGRFLRKYSLDEFPQFWNVLCGDLSVVGPRPLVRDEIARHVGDKAKSILRLRPGLTCLWQVCGRSELSYKERIALDEEYVERRSLLLDISIVVRTVPSLFLSRGAY